MTKLERLNKLLNDPGLDLPDIRRKVDPQGSNVKWLQRNLAVRNSEHVHFSELTALLKMRIGCLVKEPYQETAEQQ